MTEILTSIAVTTGVVLTLSLLVLVARSWLAPSGLAHVGIGSNRAIEVNRGEKLLWGLAANGILLPAACGGRGSCGQCRVTVVAGGGPILPTEQAHISRRDAAHGERLACMVTVRDDLDVQLPDGIVDAKRWTCSVRSNRCVTTFLKELVLELPADETIEFTAGSYVLLEAPPGVSRFADFDLDPAVRRAWQDAGLLELAVDRAGAEVRAYSIANPPSETDAVTLVVRIAVPPGDAPAGTPPGKVSSFVFGLKPGDPVVVSGPFGSFRAQESDAEMVLVGGGAGIAPLRSIILDQLRDKGTQRKLSFWYGARSVSEICYAEEFDRLAAEHDNFSWTVALSDPAVDTAWSGARGFIHAVLLDAYLGAHPAPERAEYYLCGPPLMTSAVLALLEDLGVDRDHVLFDDFGG